MKPKLLIIGSSKIVDEHIKSALKVGFQLYSLNSTRKNSINQKKLYKKYKFQKKFSNWKDAFDSAKNNKNISVLLAPRIRDNFKILKYLTKGDNLIISEKPLTTNLRQLNKLKKFKKKIFITYNRIFYENIQYLKKNIKKPSSVVVKFTDKNKKNILNNSIHIFSIIYYLFGSVRKKFLLKTKESINMLSLNRNNIPIHFIYDNNFPETYSIDIRDKNKRYYLKPLEKLKIIRKIEFKYKNNNIKMLIPKEKIEKQIDLYKINNFKPGFLNQMRYIKRKLDNRGRIGNLEFGVKVIELCKDFLK